MVVDSLVYYVYYNGFILYYIPSLIQAPVEISIIFVSFTVHIRSLTTLGIERFYLMSLLERHR